MDQCRPARQTGFKWLTDNELERGTRCRRARWRDPGATKETDGIRGTRPARGRRRGLIARIALTLVGGLCAGALPARAQLRPIEPAPWEVYQPGTGLLAQLGANVLWRQRASLAGTEGRLLELGSYDLAWRTGRVALELGGSAVRIFDDRSRWADTAGGAALRFGRRVDAGELRVGTAVRLTPERWPGAAALRFGARLPTASHVTGLEREETDFLGTLALAWRRGPLLAAAEGGIGILGTRVPAFTQEDDLVYAARVAWRLGAVRPELAFTGQSSPLRYRRPRGVEALRERRLGVRAGARRWLEATWVRGLVPFSPHSGLLLSAGISLPRR